MDVDVAVDVAVDVDDSNVAVPERVALEPCLLEGEEEEGEEVEGGIRSVATCGAGHVYS